MEIVTVTRNKKQYLDLLLLADEQESMIDRYLEAGTLYALYDPDLKSVAVVVDLNPGTCELKNLATEPKHQRQGHASRLVAHLFGHYGKQGYSTMYVGTGDSPSTTEFYRQMGFTYSHTVERFFTNNYDHPIVEDGKQLVDMLYFKKDLQPLACNRPADIEARALSLLREHGPAGWSFAWDHAKRRLGSCQYAKKRITLSRHFVSRNAENEEQINDTILHEIAHALAWVNFGERGHGWHWKQYCLQLGAHPKASAPHDIVAVPCRYVVRIRDTGEIVGRYYRKPSFARHIANMMIKGRPETRGKLELVRIDVP